MGKERKIRCCEVTIKYLRYCLIFPQEGKEHSTEYTFRIFGIFLATWLFAFGILLHFINAINNNYDIQILNFDIVLLISTTGVMWINGFFYKNRNLVIELIRSLSDYELFENPPGYEEFIKKINLYAKIHLVYIMGGSLGYFIIFAPLHTQKCKELNAEKNITELCQLFAPVYIPYLQEKIFSIIPVVYFIASWQFMLVMIIYSICGSIVWLNVECVEHIAFRIGHLKSNFIIAFKEKDDVKRRYLFGNAIKYHNEILRMGNLADKFFGTELFLHVVLTGAILGCCAFVMMGTHSLDTLMLFVGWLNAIIMGCVSGQRLINESLTIPDILHEVNWQNIDIALKKDIVLFLLRCKHPMCIRAANVTMTNHLIIEILQTAYSYVTLLSSVNTE